MLTLSAPDPLRFAVRLPVVGKLLGQLALALAALNLVPLGLSFLFGDAAMAGRFALVAALLVCVGFPLARSRQVARAQANEAMAVAALACLLSTAATAYPLAASNVSALDVWFEGVSAITTTGLSTIAHAEQMSRSFLFARAWAQWYGGLGIVIFSVALLAGHDVSVRRLVDAGGGEELLTGTRHYARRMIATYVALSAAMLVLLLAAGLAPFDAVSHMLAAVSTGGFSTRDASLAAFDSIAAQAAVTIACVLGAIALPVYYRLYRGRWQDVAHDEELRLFLLAAAGSCVALYLVRFGFHWKGGAAVRDVIVMALSAQSTAGFAVVDVPGLGSAAMVVLMLAMASGGMVGSTGGGVKLLRLLLLFRLLRLLLNRLGMPSHAVADLRIGGTRVDSEEIARAMLLVFLFMLTVLTSWIPFLALGHDPLRSLFDVVSATGTVGLSAGVTDATLAPALKLVLCADMLLGRLEFVALLVLFYGPTWFGRRSAST